MAAIDEVAARIPNLQVVAGNCHGHDWLVDPRSNIVYFQGDRPLQETGAAILEALGELCAHHDIPRAHRGLRLIPSPRAILDDRAAALTGTFDS